MRLVSLGSGSRGNAFAVTAQGHTLLIDAGFGLRTLLRRAARSQLPWGTLDAIVLTHEHGDHARGAAALARRFGRPIYASRGTLRALRETLTAVDRHVLPLDAECPIGPFQVAACRTSHDAAEPLALAVTVAGRRMGLAYDVGTPTAALRALLQNSTCLVLETNHDEAMLEAGPYPMSVRRRIAGRGGHLSNDAAARLAAELCHDGLRTVVLVHLSDRCNRPTLATRAMRSALAARGFRGHVVIARQDAALGPIDIELSRQLRLELR